MKEMGIQAIGDRVYMLEMIKLLKNKKRELETTAAKWSGETPAGGCGKFAFECHAPPCQLQMLSSLAFARKNCLLRG